MLLHGNFLLDKIYLEVNSVINVKTRNPISQLSKLCIISSFLEILLKVYIGIAKL